VAGASSALVGIALAVGTGLAAYVPLAHQAAGGQASLDLAPTPGSNALPPDQVLARLKPLLDRIATTPEGFVLHPGVQKNVIDKRQKTVQVSGFFDDGEALFEAAAEQGLQR